MDFNGTDFRPKLSTAFRKLVLGRMFGEKPSKEEKESLLAAAHNAMTKLEQQISHNFIAGEHLSIADIQVFFELTLFKVMFHHDLDSSHSHLAQWYH